MTGRTFVGGMNIEVPGAGVNRFAATIPFARLRISDVGLWLGTAPLALPKRASFIAYLKDEVHEVFRSRGFLHVGVGIETSDGKTHYFSTLHPQWVLAELAERGYRVGGARQPRVSTPLGIFAWPRKHRP